MIASMMVMVDMDCHISAVFWHHVIASVMVMADMDCRISAVFWRHVIASVMVMVDMDCHISAVWDQQYGVAMCLPVWGRHVIASVMVMVMVCNAFFSPRTACNGFVVILCFLV